MRNITTVIIILLSLSRSISQIDTSEVVHFKNEEVIKQGLKIQQEIKFKFKQKGDYCEEYNVLKSKKKTKHGPYTKYRIIKGQIILLELGNYKNGQKDGYWEHYYDSANLEKSWNRPMAVGQYENGKKEGLWKYYYVDTSEYTIKQQVLQPNKKNRTTIITGQKSTKLRALGHWSNGQRTGTWKVKSFDQKDLFRYNFDHHELDEIDTITNINLDRGPLLLGDYKYLLDFLFEHMEIRYNLPFYPKKLKDQQVHITISIGSKGELTDISVIKNDTSMRKIKIKPGIEATIDSWIPAMTSGRSIKSVCNITFDFITRADSNCNNCLAIYYKIDQPILYEFRAIDHEVYQYQLTD